jgi:CBS domain-containing protein
MDLTEPAAQEVTMQAQDVMTSEVVSVRPQTHVAGIARLLIQKKISGLPVIDDEQRLVGVVSEADLTSRTECGTEYPRHSWLGRLLMSPAHSAIEYTKTHGVHAAEVMTSPAIAVAADTPLEQIAKLLDERHIRRVPVVRHGKVVGIVSRADLLDELAILDAGNESQVEVDDRQIYQQLMEALKGEPWGSLPYGEIVVDAGTVHLFGTVESEAVITAFVVAAQRIRGVKSVVNHLTAVDPSIYFAI